MWSELANQSGCILLGKMCLYRSKPSVRVSSGQRLGGKIRFQHVFQIKIELGLSGDKNTPTTLKMLDVSFSFFSKKTYIWLKNRLSSCINLHHFHKVLQVCGLNELNYHLGISKKLLPSLQLFHQSNRYFKAALPAAFRFNFHTCTPYLWQYSFQTSYLI